MKEDFDIYPAIDLRRGQVVRLVQGDPARQTQYDTDPAHTARRWLSAGVRWLHVVNLDGAFGEKSAPNLAALQSILELASSMVFSARVQFGGGLRSLSEIEHTLSMGVSRVMLGSLAVEKPDFAAEALRRFGAARVGLAMDVREGVVNIRGWTQSASIDPLQLGQRYYEQGFRTCAYTDIARDGVGSGLNLEATQAFAQATGLAVIASGGVGSLEDVRQALRRGLSGVIIGRALYEGKLDLKEALAC